MSRVGALSRSAGSGSSTTVSSFVAAREPPRFVAAIFVFDFAALFFAAALPLAAASFALPSLRAATLLLLADVDAFFVAGVFFAADFFAPAFAALLLAAVLFAALLPADAVFVPAFVARFFAAPFFAVAFAVVFFVVAAPVVLADDFFADDFFATAFFFVADVFVTDDFFARAAVEVGGIGFLSLAAPPEADLALRFAADFLVAGLRSAGLAMAWTPKGYGNLQRAVLSE